MDSMSLWIIAIIVVCVTDNMAITGAVNSPQICPENYRYYSHQNKCYKFNSTDYTTWYDARKQCQREGGDLIVIHDQETNNIVIEYMSANTFSVGEGIWLGLIEIDLVPTFEWIDGSPVNYSDWAKNDPNNDDPNGVDCVMYLHNKKKPVGWVDLPCYRQERYICEKQAEISLACPIGYESDDEKKMCYKIQYSDKTFEDSRDSCQRHGGDLVTMADVRTKKNIISLIDPSIDSISRYWIGLVRSDNVFEWLDGNVLDSSQPTGFTSMDGENCGTFDRSKQKYLYTDIGCASPFPSICQKKLSINYPVFECPQGYKPYIVGSCGTCLMFQIHDLKTWLNAKNNCAKMGGKLFEIESYGEGLHSFISDNSPSSFSYSWANLDNCKAFMFESSSFAPMNCEIEAPYICQHFGTVKLMINLTDNQFIISDKICHDFYDSKKLSKSENGTMYLNHESLIDENDLTQLALGDHEPDCLFNIEQNNVCVEATLTKPLHLINQTKIEINIPIDLLSNLCPETLPITTETFDLLRNITAPKNDSAAPNNLCPCRCDSLKIDFNPAPEVLSEIIANIQKELKVETENLSSKRNKKISAKDNRIESRAFGYVGIALFLVPIGLIVAIDISRIFQPKQ